MSAWRQAGTSTRPAASSGGLSSGWASSQKPRARAWSLATKLVRVTSSSACASCSGSRTNSGTIFQARRCGRSSASERPSRRVSIGNSMSEEGSSASQPSSTGHIVVRPGVAGRMRRPVSAKKIALMSSDLPRENSATKATTNFSLPSRSRNELNWMPAESSISSCSPRNRATSSSRCASAKRQPLRASRLVANEGESVMKSG